MSNKNTWTLEHGIYKRTIMSRDKSSESGFASMEACEAKLLEYEECYRRIGYVIRYADAIAPDGTKHQLRAGNSKYRR